MTSRNEQAEIIWQEFKNKINAEWQEKYSTFGKSISDIDKGKETVLAKCIIEDFKQDYRKRTGKEPQNKEIIAYLVLHGFIQRDGFSKNPQQNTLEIFILYIGYKDWKDFETKFISKNKEKKNILKEDIEKNEIKGKNPVFINHNEPFIKENDVFFEKKIENVIPKKTNNTKYIPYILSILVLVSGLYYYFNYYFNEDEKFTIKEIVDSANKKELSIYKSVPLGNIDDYSNSLDSFFTKNGTAKQNILGTVIKTIREKRKLRTPPSAYTLVDIQYKTKSSDEIRIETNEQWHLIWYDMQTNKDIKIYDTLNHHIYLLKLENGKWKIHMDEYKGRIKDAVN